LCNKSVLRGGFHSDALSAALSVFFLNTVNTPLSKRSKRGEDVNHAHSARTAALSVFFLNTVNTPLSKRSKRGEDVNHAHSARTAALSVFFLNTVNTPLSKRSKRGEDVNQISSRGFHRSLVFFLTFRGWCHRLSQADFFACDTRNRKTAPDFQRGVTGGTGKSQYYHIIYTNERTSRAHAISW